MPLCSQFPPSHPYSLETTDLLMVLPPLCLFWNFIEIEPHSMWSFGSGFFLSVKCFWHSSTLLCIMLVCFFLPLSSILLYGLNQTLLIQSPVGKIWVLSRVWLLWIMLLWTLKEKSLYVWHTFSFILGKYLGMRLLGCTVSLR